MWGTLLSARRDDVGSVATRIRAVARRIVLGDNRACGGSGECRYQPPLVVGIQRFGCDQTGGGATGDPYNGPLLRCERIASRNQQERSNCGGNSIKTPHPTSPKVIGSALRLGAQPTASLIAVNGRHFMR